MKLAAIELVGMFLAFFILAAVFVIPVVLMILCIRAQEFVAESLGVSRQAVSKWETGETDPTMSNLVLLAQLYGVTLAELLENVI